MVPVLFIFLTTVIKFSDKISFREKELWPGSMMAAAPDNWENSFQGQEGESKESVCSGPFLLLIQARAQPMQLYCPHLV